MIFKSAGHSAVKGKNYDPGAVGKTTANIQVTEAELTQDFENLVLAELTKKIHTIKFRWHKRIVQRSTESC